MIRAFIVVNALLAVHSFMVCFAASSGCAKPVHHVVCFAQDNLCTKRVHVNAFAIPHYSSPPP
ncbi:MAG: hypothetical protein WBD74_05675 [Candidatus Aquilonibacter sp.]